MLILHGRLTTFFQVFFKDSNIGFRSKTKNIFNKSLFLPFFYCLFSNGMTSLVPLISTLEHKALVTWVTQELHDHAFFLYQLSVRQLWPLQKHCDEMKLPRPRLPSHRQKYQFWTTGNCIWSKCIIDTFEASSAWKLWLKNIVGWATNILKDMHPFKKKKCIDIRICIHYTIGWPRVISCVVDSILCWEKGAALERVRLYELFRATYTI